MGHRILHLSDTHIGAARVDAAAALDQILHDVRHIPAIDVVVVSGDIADNGTVDECAVVLAKVGAFAAERGIPHLYTTGNHDSREAFGTVLGDTTSVTDVDGLRIITLDSLVPGETHGYLGEQQLDWLREVLAEPAPAGSVVVLHHPPIALTTSPAMQAFNLHDADRLGDVIAGTDVQVVLCGHFHLQLSGFLRGVPVWVGPAVVTRVDLTAPPHLERFVRGAGATVVDLGGPASPMFHTLHARDPLAGVEVYVVDRS